MSAETLEFHHDKHHNAYVVNGNNLLKGTGLEGKSLEDVVKASYKDDKLTGLFNNAAQHWTHIEFWQWMTPNGGGSIPGELETRLASDFGTGDTVRDDSINAGVHHFRQGWCRSGVGTRSKLE